MKNIKLCPKCKQQMYYHEKFSGVVVDWFENMNEWLLPTFVCWICFECSLVIEDEDYKYDDVEKRSR